MIEDFFFGNVVPVSFEIDEERGNEAIIFYQENDGSKGVAFALWEIC